MSERTQPKLTDRTDDVLGTGAAVLPEREGVWASVKPSEYIDEDSTIYVAGHWLDDEAPSVECHLFIGNETVVLNLTTDRARELAEDLTAAADRADRGDEEMGSGA